MLIKIYLTTLIVNAAAAWFTRRAAVGFGHQFFVAKNNRSKDFNSYWEAKNRYEYWNTIQACLIGSLFVLVLIGILGSLWIFL